MFDQTIYTIFCYFVEGMEYGKFRRRNVYKENIKEVVLDAILTAFILQPH